ncbi:MAG: O-antigen ligase family protein [Bacteroidales bacterium]|nr:O-antigen ligase family protein [Bacteroidales bacterium]MBN2698377.1 O-antigen ligase family protein [Bacteroidales bacterium]
MIRALQHNNQLVFWSIVISFMLLNTVLLLLEIYFVPLIPAVLFFIILAFVSIEKFLFVTVLLVPLSIPLSTLAQGLSVDLHLPTEPLLAVLLVLFFLKYLCGHRLDIRILRHPVTLAIYFQLAWIFITAITSTDPLVSFKLLISRTWFVIGFYLLATQLFQNEKNIQTYGWMYIISFTLVIIYTIARHAGYGLDDQQMAHRVMRPFYKDHTSYGATIAMLLPLLIGLFQMVKKENINTRFLMALLILFYGLAIVFSYTRAAWLSLIAAFAVWLILRLKIKFEFVMIAAVIMVALVFSVRTQIMIQLEQNRQESSGDLAEHVQSMSNIRSDQSNLERINRWSCAYRMWKDKPLFGFGPGTYQFEYGSYQRSYEKTRISTDFGIMGTAHSEYLLALSESGFPGMLSLLVIVILTIATGVRVYKNAPDQKTKIMAVSILMGLVTYYVHGLLNNFLDTDKASALFWGYTGMLVAMDVYQRKSAEE